MIVDKASSTKNHDEALAAYPTAWLLSLSIPNILLIKWASMTLNRGSANGALTTATDVCFPC